MGISGSSCHLITTLFAGYIKYFSRVIHYEMAGYMIAFDASLYT